MDLNYFVDGEDFSRAMVDHADQDPMWLDGLMRLKDAKGVERMAGRFSKMKSLGECVGRGLYSFNERSGKFDVKLAEIPLDAPLSPAGHPFLVMVGEEAYYYFGDEFPCMRVKATVEAVSDLKQYEAFTCLKLGARIEGWDGASCWIGMRTGCLSGGGSGIRRRCSGARQEKLIEAKKMKAAETPLRIYDAQTKKAVRVHAVRWSGMRFGRSMSGSLDRFSASRRCWGRSGMRKRIGRRGRGGRRGRL